MQIDKLLWETLARTEGDNLVIDFEGLPRRIALIPFEVLEDGLQTSNEEPLTSAGLHRLEVEQAITKALSEANWRELVTTGTGQKLFQLWLKRRHFGK